MHHTKPTLGKMKCLQSSFMSTWIVLSDLANGNQANQLKSFLHVYLNKVTWIVHSIS